MNRLGTSAFGGALTTAVLLAAVSPGWTQPAGAKALVDQAKAAGVVGEQADGLLGLVRGSGPSTEAAVAEINAGRARVYQATAEKTGVTPQAAGEATARQLFARLPPGQYYKPVGEGWRRK